MVDGARLESVCALTSSGGSNPPLSALFKYGSPVDESRYYAKNSCQTPSGSEESSGRRIVLVP